MKRTTYLLGLAVVLTACLATTASAQTETLMLQDPTVHGTSVVFVYGDNLYKASTSGGTAVQLTTHAGFELRPRFSPDGSRIAFTGQYDGNSDVFVIPATGGTPERLTYHPAPEAVEGWTADGKQILLRSTALSSTPRYSQLFTLAPGAPLPEVLPLPMAERGSYSPDGKQLVYLQIREAWYSWKRYRGGETDPLRIVNLATLETTEIPGADVNNSYPVWLSNGIFFISDRAGIMNVFHYDPATKAVKQVTQHKDYDVKTLSGNGDQLVYEQGGRVHLLNATSLETKPLQITVVGDLTLRRPHWVQATDFMQGAGISPTGKRAVFASRGDIITVPLEDGDARNITQSTGAFERDPAWSPDGKSIAYFVVEGQGEYRLAVKSQVGKTVKYYDLDKQPTYYYNPIWSPDSKHIAFTTKGTNGSNLRYITLADGKLTTIDGQLLEGLNTAGMNLSWSSDSKWITYSKTVGNFLSSVYLYDVAKGSSQAITDAMAYMGDPVFSHDSKYIFFTASTNAGLAISGLDMSSQEQQVTNAIYAVVLAQKTPSPFRPKSDEEAAEKNEGSVDTSKVVVVDVPGIMQRTVVLDLPDGLYFTGLQAGEDALFIVTDGDEASTLHKYDLQKQKLSTHAEGIVGYDVSADYKKVLVIYPGWSAVIAGTDSKVDPSEGQLKKLASAQVWVDPAREWEQMYDEIWRIQRDFFYVPNMHGADWKAIREKYRPFIKHVPHRDVLNDIFADLIGELVIGHAYVGAGDFDAANTVSTGMLGADFTIENGFYHIQKIYNGENWNPDLKAPLTEPGVKATAGDYILAIDGIELKAPTSIYSLLQNKAGKQVTLRLNSRPSSEGAHDELVVPIGSETGLRNRAWLESRRHYVDSISKGRVGYVYMPNTGDEGYQYFRRYFYAQLDKEAVVLDERFNGGGQVADYVIDMLGRKTMNYWVPRTGALYKSPMSALDGPKAMVINEYAGSGGDYMPWAFKEAGLGKLVGERTWGGLVGIAGTYALMDDGFITSPSFGILSKDGKWIIENVGVPADIQVWQDPKLVKQGRDPQLDAAVEQVLKELQAKPTPPAPARPTGPNRVGY